jgi:pimeloyl-ACP methyl ester carboxylesterase
MLDDAREAIEFVRRQAPQRRIIVAGLCSGGWLAFQAARHDLGVDGVISINAPFYLYDSDRQWLRDSRAIARYQRAARDPAKWRKVLRGHASYAAFTRLATATLARHISVRLAAVARREPVDAFARDLCAIAHRGTSCLFVFSSGDNGLAYFLRHAQSTLRRSDVHGLMRHVVVENAGHTFRPTAAQRALAGLLDDFVTAPASATSAG